MRTLGLCACVFLLFCLGFAGKANEHHYWLRLPRATLLIGPGTADFLVASRPDQTRQILPTADQPRVGSYTAPVFPSISRDGRIIACIRWLSLNPQLADVATYSVPQQNGLSTRKVNPLEPYRFRSMVRNSRSSAMVTAEVLFSCISLTSKPERREQFRWTILRGI
jgi:hypothetical protein